MLEVAVFFEVLQSVYQTSWSHIQEDHNLHIYHTNNLQSHVIKVYLKALPYLNIHDENLRKVYSVTWIDAAYNHIPVPKYLTERKIYLSVFLCAIPAYSFCN
jgi:hypothetical protein